MKKEMLINVLQSEECRIAIVEDGVLEELYVERSSQESYVNNIYKGRIVNIEPSIQAAFVDFGIGRNGFLHVSDVDPVYYKHLEGGRGGGGERRDRGERGDRGGRGRDRGERGDHGERGDRGRRPAFTPVEIPPGDVVPPEFEEEQLPQQMTGWLEPAAPATGGPIDEDDEPFGAGLLEEAAPHIEDRGEAPTAEDIPAEATSLSEVVGSLPGSESAEAPAEARRKRGGAAPRGRGRAKKAEGEEPAAGAEPKSRRRGGRRKSGDAEEAPAGEKPAEGGPDDEKPPRVMPSAERRTTEENEPDTAPGGEGGDVFFDPFAPNDRFTEPSSRPAPRRERPPEPEDEGPEAEAETEEEEFEEPAEGAPEAGDEDDDEDIFGGARRGEDEGFDEDRSRGRGPRGRGDRDRGDRGGRGGRPGGPRRTFGRDGGRPKPPIQEIFKRGQEVIVQVIKEGIGTKGPTLSTYISIAGRYLVLMPSLNRVAVSRKIVDEGVRARLKESLTELNPPKGIGFIIRTASIDRNKSELRADLAYLVRLWEVFASRVLKRPAPVEIYRESDMITRTIRDIFTSDIDTIWVDEPNAFAQAAEFLKIVMPRYADRIKHYADTEPIFHRFKIEQEIARINEKKIPLAMGGSIVIEQTEALVAIDVNSGNFRAENNAEETAYQMNMQAAKEIGRQLRLRDLGGVIVNDFIDMKQEQHRRAVEQALRNALRRDRARTKILKTSAFGVIEMTRQRIRPSLRRSIYHDCPHCRATGYVKTNESMSIEVMRLIQMAAHRKTVRQLNARVHLDVAQYLLNKKRRELLQWEEVGGMQVTVTGLLGVSPEHLELQGFDNNGNEVKVLTAEPPRALPERRPQGDRDRGGRDRGDRGDRGGRGRDRGDRGGRGRREDREDREGRPALATVSKCALCFRIAWPPRSSGAVVFRGATDATIVPPSRRGSRRGLSRFCQPRLGGRHLLPRLPEPLPR
jgi:ribonuclease E